VLALIKHYGVAARPVASGAAAVTLTQAMTGQIDVGWASPPFGLAQLQDGAIRIIARGSDVPSTRDQTVRVHIANAGVLARRRDVIARYMQAYREALDFLYDNPEGVKIYAQYAKVSEVLAARIRDEFLPKAAEQPDRVFGIDAITQDAITFKVLPAPLTLEQLAELIQIPPRQK
jgi:NitT/TauT family transport system substrate-binding protein